MKFEDFTGLYSQSKTLRFGAIPIGVRRKTGVLPESETSRFEPIPVDTVIENFVKSGVWKRDQHRAESYVKMKKLIDEYHKDFIDRALANGALPYEGHDKKDSLEEYYALYTNTNRDAQATEDFDEVKKNLREAVVKKLVSAESYGNIFKKELVTNDLPRFIARASEEMLCSMSKDQAQKMVAEFNTFTTYFTGFHENRKNMYTAEEKSTGIAYRLVNDNLPKFVDNMKTFAAIMEIPELQANMQQLYTEMEEYLNVPSIDDMFRLDYYNMLLTQKQITVYNTIIGGRVAEGVDKKIQGINEYINLYNQKHKDQKLPQLKMLFKQILSDREAISWLPEQFEKDSKVIEAINDAYKELTDNVLGEGALKQMLWSLSEYNLSGIYISNDVQLTEISQKIFGNWNVIGNAIERDVMKNTPRNKKENDEKYQERIAKIIKSAKSFSIKYIDDCLKNAEEKKTIESYFSQLGKIKDDPTQSKTLFERISDAYTEASQVLRGNISSEDKLAQSENDVKLIKALLDSIKDLQRFVKPLLGSGDESDKDERFYGDLQRLWQELGLITPLYNKVRNYMTKKPYSVDKIKINFDNSQLLSGWDKNKEPDYSSFLLRKDGMYFLAIMDKQSKSLLGKPMPSDGPCYEKMEYKLLPGANKMLPKVFFAKSRLDEFKPSQELVEKYAKGTHKKGKDFNLQDCHNLIDYFKHSIEKHEDWSKFGFNFSNTSTYEDLSGFYREVEQQGYKLSFVPVSESFIDQLVADGKLYLFQIYNKDFSEHSHGTPNMHTMYWKMLFDERNLADVVFQLNGGAELFFRQKSLNYTRPTHPAEQPIKNKNILNAKAESTFNYDLIKNRRFTVDKFQFHVPITLNFKSSGQDNINQQVRQYLHDADDIHVIGIDRGERHLLYYSVIDLKGNIKEQGSLNTIVGEYKGNTYSTDYHGLLDKRETERREARQSWQTIENIKELKEGYLSQVVHKITQLMVKYHAIVVLEDLNFGFMRGRQKVEKQVYQKFEKMLVDKLNYLVDKKLDAGQPGGLLHAYQLASKFTTFQALHQQKQSGFLFYVPAWNTSKIDPVTGFVNLFDTRYTNSENAQKFFSKFDSIRYNDEKGWYEFTFDYKEFTNKAEGTRTRWTLCTVGNRIKTFRNPDKNSEWDNKEIDLTEEFTRLFTGHNIDIHGNLKDSITALKAEKEAPFFKELMDSFRLLVQMRNSIIKDTTDYLVSPVVDADGNFYDSRTCSDSLPKDADANGAYNIARKGLMMISQIKAADKDVKFDLSNKEWLNFAQQKPYRDE